RILQTRPSDNLRRTVHIPKLMGTRIAPELIDIAQHEVWYVVGQITLCRDFLDADHLLGIELRQQDGNVPRADHGGKSAAKIEKLRVSKQIALALLHEVGVHEGREPVACDAQGLEDRLSNPAQGFLDTRGDD